VSPEGQLAITTWGPNVFEPANGRFWEAVRKERPDLYKGFNPLFALRKIVEKEIDRSNATVPGDDKIGSRVSWWFAGSARYPSNPSGIT
jgi:hypothetical protein